MLNYPKLTEISLFIQIVDFVNRQNFVYFLSTDIL